MNKRIGIVLIGAILAGGAGLYMLKKDDPSSISALQDSPNNETTVDETARPTGSGQRSAQTSTPLDRQGLGGDNLRLQDTLRAVIALKGSDSREVAGMLNSAMHACSKPATKADNSRSTDAQHAWAIQYVEAACQGFDASEFRYTGPPLDIAAIAKKEGKPAAASKALAEISTSNNYFDVASAGWYLIEENQLANQEGFGVSQEALAEAFAYASALTTCGQMNACGTKSLLTAQICSTHGCPPGTNYAQALNLILSPKEQQLVQELRSWLSEQRG
ncbi:MAG: hypothetical protein WKF61_02850 [Luteimonas sp.]